MTGDTSVKFPRPWMWGLAAAILVVDQFTKHLVLNNFFPGKSVEVIPGFLYWTYVQNDGIAFGLFQGNNLLMGAVVVFILAVAIYGARHLKWELVSVNLFAGLVCGGAIGNLIDRAQHGFVVDFVDADLGFMRWPAFNVADSSICIAMALMIYLTLRGVDLLRIDTGKDS